MKGEYGLSFAGNDSATFEGCGVGISEGARDDKKYQAALEYRRQGGS